MTDFCVLCGSADVEFPPLCKACFLKREHFTYTLPTKVKVKLCGSCGRLIPGGGRPESAEGLRNPLRYAAERKVVVEGEVDSFSVDVENIQLRDGCQGAAETVLSVIVKGQQFEKRGPLTFRVEDGCCEECSRMRGGFFEAVVQVRGTGRTLTDAESEAVEGVSSELLERMREEGAVNSFLSKCETAKGGVDLYIGGNGPGKAVAERLAETFQSKIATVTATLHSEKEGRKLYRTTYLVRVPMARSGDIVLVDKRLLQVLGGRNTLDLVDLRTAERIRMDRDELERGELVAGETRLEPAVVVSNDAGLLQVVHPASQRTVSIKALEPVDPGVEIWTLAFEGELVMAYRRG